MFKKMTPPHFFSELHVCFLNVEFNYAKLNDIYAASPFLRINFKKQSCCLTSFGSFLLFKNVNRIYAKLTLFIFLLIIVNSIQSSWASDVAKEKRWAEQISDSLLDGEAIQLNNGSYDFLAIETLADDASELGVIILHGLGVHPDWPAIIQPLRVQLAESGWNTLSLQMPILNNDAKDEDYEPLLKEVPTRIDAGIRQLSKRGAKKIAIVAHSMGARMASYYLSHKKLDQEAQTETPIVVYVSIGMGVDDKNFLGKVKIPVFDIYGENDLKDVVSTAPDRLRASSKNKAFKQIKVAKANHFFDGQNEALMKVVKESLNGF